MNKKTILLVFAMFGLPVLIAILMHSQWFDWRPGDTRNHGTLIRPVIEWQSETVADVSGASVDIERLENRWFLVLHTLEMCDSGCLESLYWLRQIRLSQDRHVPDIGLLLIHEPVMPEELIEEIKALSDVFIIVDGADASAIGGQFPNEGETTARYILDPMANIIMRYQTDQPPDEIRKDLGRLLTWTQSQ